MTKRLGPLGFMCSAVRQLALGFVVVLGGPSETSESADAFALVGVGVALGPVVITLELVGGER